jgi:aspartate aminotransferase
VHCRPDTFDLDLEAIATAITARTRAIIVNSPNNPTGRIYPPASLRQLAAHLEQASRRNDRTIYLVSDESYNRIVYDGRAYISPAAFYPNTLLVYTYGKTLLTPGQRIGYIALTPAMPDRKELRQAIYLYQYVSGYLFPNALLQHALPDLEKLSIDVSHLQEKRDRFYSALQAHGYQLHKPDGTFYLLVRSPLENDLDFSARLAEKNVLVLPGALFEMPGYFRISLTGTMEMIAAALPVFKEALSWRDGRG